MGYKYTPSDAKCNKSFFILFYFHNLQNILQEFPLKMRYLHNTSNIFRYTTLLTVNQYINQSSLNQQNCNSANIKLHASLDLYNKTL